MNIVTRWMSGTLVFAVVAYMGTTNYGWRLGRVGFSWDPTRQQVEALTRKFQDDIRFKDFARASTYHTASDQAAVNIPALIESKFGIKPEELDFQEARIARIDVDPDGRRAKALVVWHTRLLNTKEIRDVEGTVYWQKAADGRWYMQLRSSL